VRLKERDGIYYGNRKQYISIPTGAIKRSLMRKLRNIQKSISIPTGAIKSILLCIAYYLKHEISIPTGAIKSISAQPDLLPEYGNFNSYWCD
jgi:hypothetical protein